MASTVCTGNGTNDIEPVLRQYTRQTTVNVKLVGVLARHWPNAGKMLTLVAPPMEFIGIIRNARMKTFSLNMFEFDV